MKPELTIPAPAEEKETREPDTQEVVELAASKIDTLDQEVKPVVPDGGYGWIIVLGCFVTHIILGGFLRADGIFFLAFLSKFGHNAKMTSFPVALLTGVRLCFSPLANAMCERYSVRTSVILGGVIFCLGLWSTGLAPNIYFLFFSVSLLQGAGGGLFTSPSLVIVGMYFDKHRSLAAGLGSSGVGVGSFLLLPLIEYLFLTYGFQGTFLILSAIGGHMIAVGLLFRSPPSPTKPSYLRDSLYLSSAVSSATHATPQVLPTPSNIIVQPYAFSSSVDAMADPMATSSNTPTFKKREMYRARTIGLPAPSINEIFPGSPTHITHGDLDKKKLCHCYLLRNSAFLFFCMNGGLFVMALKITLTYLPALIASTGLSKSRAAEVLALSGIADTISRIGFGIFLDHPYVQPYRLIFYAILPFVLAAASVVLTFLDTEGMFILCYSIYGFITGAYMSQNSVVIVDILGVELLGRSFGLVLFFQGFGSLLGPVLAGALKDWSGSYSWTMHMSAACMVLSGLSMLACNAVRKPQVKSLSSIVQQR